MTDSLLIVLIDHVDRVEMGLVVLTLITGIGFAVMTYWMGRHDD